MGYYTEGGGLTYLIVRNAGHMVPISQPRWGRDIVYEFTHKTAKKRFTKPDKIVKKITTAFAKC